MEAARHRPITLAILIAIIIHILFLYYYFTFEVRKNSNPLWIADNEPAFVMLDAPKPLPKPAAQTTKDPKEQQKQQQSPQAPSTNNTVLQQPRSSFNDSPWNVQSDDEVVTLDGAIVDGNSFSTPAPQNFAQPAAPQVNNAQDATSDQELLDTDDTNDSGDTDESQESPETQVSDTKTTVPGDTIQTDNLALADHARKAPPQEMGLVNLDKKPEVQQQITQQITKPIPSVVAPTIAKRQVASALKRTQVKKQQSKQLAQLADAFSQNFEQRKQQDADVTMQRAKVMAQRVGEFKAVSYFQKVYQALYDSFMRSDPVVVDVAIQKVIKMVIVINKNGRPIDVQLPMRTGCIAVDNHIIATIQRTRFPAIPEHLNKDTVTLPCEAFVNLPPGNAVINFHYR